MSNYDSLAMYYDVLTRDVDYSRIADFYELLFDKYGIHPGLMLDLACGTGTLTYLLAGRGYEMIGADMSDDMLSVAMAKSADYDVPIQPLFLRQDMRELDLYGTVSATVCALDGINYLQPEDLRKVFRRLSLFVEPGGIFIFDINSPKRLHEQDGQVFIDETDDIFCTWRAEYDKDNEACVYGFDVFVRDDNDLWERFSEEHTEYAHSCAFIQNELEKAGFGDVSFYGDFSLRPPEDGEERIVISAVNKRKD